MDKIFKNKPFNNSCSKNDILLKHQDLVFLYLLEIQPFYLSTFFLKMLSLPQTLSQIPECLISISRVSGFHVPSLRCQGLGVPGLGVLGLRVSWSRVPGSRVSGPGSQGPGLRVSGLGFDFRLCHAFRVLLVVRIIQFVKKIHFVRKDVIVSDSD